MKVANVYRWLGLVIGANVESVSILLGTWWLAKLLDEAYPIKLSWMAVLIPISVVYIFKVWATLIKKLIKDKNGTS